MTLGICFDFEWKLLSVQEGNAAIINEINENRNEKWFMDIISDRLSIFVLFLAWEWAMMMTMPRVLATPTLCPVNGSKEETPAICLGPPAAAMIWKTSWGDLYVHSLERVI